ncbi:MAG: phosphoadenylyl-sulfate reductase [Alphaproteobacteria bacterium]
MSVVTDPALVTEAARLDARFAGSDGRDLLAWALGEGYGGRIAVVSSFGAESAVLLHLVASTAPATPVVFLDTGMLFAQTLQYQRELAARLGLPGVVAVRPDAGERAGEDADDTLHQRDTDACCNLRKVRPLERALAGYEAWITGRKRFQATTRAALPLVEAEGRHLKFNPLAHWSAEDIDAWFVRHDLPRHPLWEFGYLSLGCWPCTRPVEAGEDVRAGRWSGQDKTECGIHGNRWTAR